MDKRLRALLHYQLEKNKEALKKLVIEGKLTLFDYQDITKDMWEDVPIEAVKKSLYKKIDEYKHEKSTWFEYDGHAQRYLEFDRITMRDCQEALQDGHMTSVRWKYPDAYVDVTDGAYFFNMRLLGAQNLTMCFEVEKMMRGEIDLMETVEDFMAYNYKEKFDGYFQTIKNGE